MRKLILTGALALSAFFSSAQFTSDNVVYFVGEGPDTAYLEIDFLDGTEDSAYVWGFLFDDALDVSGGDILAAIAADEEKLDVIIEGGFLNEIHYNNHAGLGGDPDFWGTWSKTEETEWVLNGGLATLVEHGDWFGCSYTDFDPEIAPGDPLAAYESARYHDGLVQFWVGEGSDSAVFVIDFVESESGQAMTYAWGYAFDVTTDGATMLADIASADVNLTINAEAFLNDILFNDLQGLAGDPHYWATWSGTNLSDWTMNAGLLTTIVDGDWFGCSYASWPPRRPFYPISALDSVAFTHFDTEFVIGSGSKEVVIVIDYNEWLPGHSYAYGYLFEGETITAEEVLEALQDDGIYGLTFDLMGGFLNSVECEITADIGLGGAPNYWSTWSADNVGGWVLNSGISEELHNGDWFACSYTSWGAATPPSLPMNGPYAFGFEEVIQDELTVYPNPSNGEFQIDLEQDATVTISDVQGNVVTKNRFVAGVQSMQLTNLAKGTYLLSVETNERMQSRLILIK